MEALIATAIVLLMVLSFFMKDTHQVITIIGIIVLIGVLVRKSSDLNYSSHTIKLLNINSVKLRLSPSHEYPNPEYLHNYYLYLSVRISEGDSFEYRKKISYKCFSQIRNSFRTKQFEISPDCKVVEFLRKGEVQHQPDHIFITFPENSLNMAIVQFSDYQCIYNKDSDLHKEIDFLIKNDREHFYKLCDVTTPQYIRFSEK